MNEKSKTETLGGARSIQRGTESQETLRGLEAQEARLFAARGHGGYIDSEEITAIREKLARIKAEESVREIGQVQPTPA